MPIEVKAQECLKSKSLKAYCEKFEPACAVCTSMSNFREQDWMSNVPRAAVGDWERVSGSLCTQKEHRAKHGALCCTGVQRYATKRGTFALLCPLVESTNGTNGAWILVK